MGTLKPGVKYVYERNDNIVYAREFGSSERTVVGYDYDPINGHKINYDSRTPDGRPLHDYLAEAKLWGDIRREAQTNVTLQRALDRAIMIYKLSKDKV
jgi:hypothetical protein